MKRLLIKLISTIVALSVFTQIVPVASASNKARSPLYICSSHPANDPPSPCPIEVTEY